MSDDTQAALLPCPFCGEVPDVNDPYTFQADQGDKWGHIVCCCNGPEVRTGYGPLEEWKADAIREWNTRSLPAAAALLREAGWTVEEPKCETCGGSGRVMSLFGDGGSIVTEPCPTCNGTGKRP